MCMKLIYRLVVLLLCQFYFSSADADTDAEMTDKLIEEYSDLIDVAVSDEPVYDFELRDSKRQLLKNVRNDSDKNRIVDVVGRLLNSTHKYAEVEYLGKPVTYTINYSVGFLIQLGTEKAYERLLNEYEFWNHPQVTSSMRYVISRVSDHKGFNGERFTELQNSKAEAIAREAEKHKGTIYIPPGTTKICCY